MKSLKEKTLCLACFEIISVTAEEVLEFETIECPGCGLDVYHTDSQYKEAEAAIA